MRIAKLNDWHIPYHDKRALNVAFNFVEATEPEIIIIDEVNDFYALSKFSKDPRRRLSMQDELDLSLEWRNRLRSRFPLTRIIELDSNHNKRLTKYLEGQAPELAYLRCLDMKHLLGLDGMRIEYMDDFIYKGILFKHGDLVKKDSCATAKAEFTKEGMSGASGHCFDSETEILTKNGWKKYGEFSKNDFVGTRNKETGKFEWNKINEIHEYKNYKELYRMVGQSYDLMVTDKHGILYKSRYGVQRETTADRLPVERFFMYNSCEPSEGNSYDENKLRLIVNILADGCIEDGAICWHLKKKRKIDRLCFLLNSLNMTYSNIRQRTGKTKIRLCTKDSFEFVKIVGIEKEMPEWLKDLDLNCSKIILDEYSKTDGCKNKSATNSYQLVSYKTNWLDILQELFVKNGMRATKNKKILTVNTKNGIWTERKYSKKVPYSGLVWCVNVDNGTLLVRRNGKVCVTLNTHRGGVFYKRLRGGNYSWTECGCLCRLDPDYIKGTADWIQGVGLFTFEEGSTLYDPKFFSFNKYKVLWGSKTIGE